MFGGPWCAAVGRCVRGAEQSGAGPDKGTARPRWRPIKERPAQLYYTPANVLDYMVTVVSEALPGMAPCRRAVPGRAAPCRAVPNRAGVVDLGGRGLAGECGN